MNTWLVSIQGLLQAHNCREVTDGLVNSMSVPERLVKAINRARVSINAGQPMLALPELEKAVERSPKFAEGWILLGQAKGMTGDHAGAEACFRKALALQPRHSGALFMLGLSLFQQGRFGDALEFFHRCCGTYIGQDPPVGVLHNIASCLLQLDRYGEAESICRRILPIDDGGDAWALLGIACQGQNKATKALEAYRKAIERGKTDYSMYLNSGVCHYNLCEYDMAAEYASRALEFYPDDSVAKRNRILALGASGRLDAAAPLLAELDSSPDLQSFLLYASYTYDKSPGEVREYHERIMGRISRPVAPHSLPDAPGQNKIRLGIVCGDFRFHPVIYFSKGLMEHWDRNAFDVTVYSTHLEPDLYTEMIKGLGWRWVDCPSTDRIGLALKIRNDQPHMLIDLTGFTSAGVTDIFSQRLAPIQASYIGYGATSGMAEMDYFITDPVLDPPGDSESHYTEKLVRTDGPFVTYSPLGIDVDVGPLPALRNGHMTFGSFSQLAKVTNETLDLWGAALRAVPDSRFIFCAKGLNEESTRDRFFRKFEERGVAQERIIASGGLEFADYLSRHGEIDLLLETIPWNAHTTAMHGLWMGVPTVTVKGDRHVSRFGEHVLHYAGLPEFVAPSGSDYGFVIKELVSDLARLSEIRETLRSRLAASPLLDHSRLASNLGAVFRDLVSRFYG